MRFRRRLGFRIAPSSNWEPVSPWDIALARGVTVTDCPEITAAQRTFAPWRRHMQFGDGNFPVLSKWTSPELVMQRLGDKGLT
jgi:hypothetical protein